MCALASAACDKAEAPELEAPAPAAISPPNIVVIFTDDQGYGDLGCYGHPTIRTPHIDRLAAEGAKFTSWYAGSPVCSPSRVALLTGCYPKRVGMQDHVVYPDSVYGLHTDEVTLAEVLREAGYATGMFGKWHVGHRPGLLPLDQGFDRWLGVPYSNDMSRWHRAEEDGYAFQLPLIRDREVIEWEPDQRQLTKRYTEAAVEFIDAHAKERFFLYLPHSMPHRGAGLEHRRDRRGARAPRHTRPDPGALPLRQRTQREEGGPGRERGALPGREGHGLRRRSPRARGPALPAARPRRDGRR